MGTNSVARIAPQLLRGRTIRRRPSWRRDLNHVLSGNETISVDSFRAVEHRAPLLERARRFVTLIATTTKPFDVLAEGLRVKNSRDDRTPIELFVEVVSSIEVRSAGLLNQAQPPKV
jgi:hypothetical protein